MKKTLFAILLLFVANVLYSQKNFTAASGEAAGNATISYSLGLVHYIAIAGSNLSLSQGVQHGYEIIPEKSQSWKIPTGFIPNPGGSSGGIYDPQTLENSIFFPIVEGVTDYQLLIFNRWGEIVFTSKEVLKGWDGYYRGSEKMCAQDVYVWKATGKYATGKSFNKTGSITLLK
jgi:hypothetical protein|tara:strand:+ start:1879 stop:2400 length:522 start_codon:yes stop_codon:yes gene_type:complete